MPDSKAKVDSLLKLGKIYFDSLYFEDALITTRDAISIAEKIKYNDGAVLAKVQLSEFYMFEDDIEAATNELLDAIDKFDSGHKDDYKLQCEVYLKLGENFQKVGLWDISIEFLTLAKNLAIKNKDTFYLAQTYNHLAAVYFENSDIQPSISTNNSKYYADKAAFLANQIKSNKVYIKSLNLLGLISRYKFKSNKDARKYYSTAFYLAKQDNETNIIPALCYNLGILNEEERNFDSVKYYAEIGLKIADSLRKKEYVGLLSKLLSNYYQEEKDYQNAYNFYRVYADNYYEISKKKEAFRLKSILTLKSQKEKEAQIQADKKIRNLIIIIFVISSFLLMMGIVALYSRQKSVKKINLQLQHTNKEIQEKNESLDLQNKIINEQNAHLEEINAAKDKLFSIISHDLKNPIGGLKEMIHVFAENLKDFSEEEKEEILQELKLSSANVLDLLMSLLTWSRSQRGKIDFEPFLQDLKLLVIQNLNMLLPLARKKSITLVDDVNENTFCYFDANMINTVIRNLITNAIKFTPAGGTITVSAKEYPKNNEFILVSVKDTGIGIPADKIDNLFKVSQTYTTVGTEGEKGTGLGLLIVKDFIIKHNGEIWAESKQNEGSTFYFTIPKTLEVFDKYNPAK